jgi:uncharacterized protein (TIRG00374 family)
LKRILPKFKPVYLLWLLVPPLLWLALKDINWADVWAAASHLTWWQLIVLTVLNIVVLFFLSIGWWLILRAQGYQVPLHTLTAYRVAAFGVGYFTPGPQFGGEPLQIFLLTRNHNIPMATATAATALDRVLEVLVNFLVMATGVLLVIQWNLIPGVSFISTLLMIGGLCFAIAWFLFASWRGDLPITRALRVLPIRAERYQTLVNLIEESERQISQFCRSRPQTLITVILMSCVCWALILLEYWLVMYFLGLSMTMPQLITAVTINRVAFLIPLPGGLGALEGSQVLAMTLLGLDTAFGVTQSLIIRIRDVLTGLVGLAIGWERSGKRYPDQPA